MMVSIKNKTQTGILIACFFASGAAALVYEVVWTRHMETVLGNTLYAVATVLAAFMGGLAVGGALGGKLADRVGRPLLWYAFLELGIGAYALAFPSLLEFGDALYLAWVGSKGEALVGARVAVAVLLVAPPAVLMGLTFPMFLRHAESWAGRLAHSGALWYGINTAGAVAGVLGASFWLLPGLGRHGTALVAVGVNLVVALTAGVLAFKRETSASTSLREKKSWGDDSPAPFTWPALMAALTGFSALVYEVTFTRALVMTVGGSVYAFSTMLAAFLIGIAAGSLLISKLSTTRVPKDSALFLAVGGMGLSGLAVYWSIPSAPEAFLHLYTWLLKFNPDGVGLMVTIQVCLAIVLMIPCGFFSGAAFPLALHAAGAGRAGVGRTAGKVYALNTVGAVAGSLAAGFWLVPSFGLQNSILAMIVLNVGAALIYTAKKAEHLGGLLKAAAALALVMAILVGMPRWDAQRVSNGMFHWISKFKPEEMTNNEFLERRLNSMELLYYREGLVSTVTVEKDKETGILALSTNGKVEASSRGDMATQVLLAHYPLLWWKALKDDQQLKPAIALVGLGSGITAGSALTHPLAGMDVMEIEQGVVEASHWFDSVNGRPLESPMTRLVVDDARHFLRRRPGRYDIVISEPSNPWLAGVASLFTRESFEIGKKALKPGGVFCQWIQIYGLKPQQMKSLLKTFASVFENTLVWTVPSYRHRWVPDGDLVVLGWDGSPKASIAVLEKTMQKASVGSDLRRVRVPDLPRLLAEIRMNKAAVQAYAKDAVLNTDDNGLIEYGAPKVMSIRSSLETLQSIQGFQVDPLLLVKGIKAMPPARSEALFKAMAAELGARNYLGLQQRYQEVAGQIKKHGRLK